MFTHTQEKRFLCDQCGFGAPTKTRLRRHAKSHLQTRNFVCEYCPYKASCKTHLRRHMRIHINSRPFKCPYCKYTCNTHENMRKHILRTQKHKGKKLYPCHLCNNYGSDSSREFKAHLMSVHADYLKENAVDSLAVFSGLYRRDEDFQKPKEGSEIIQVTKGRFFRSYQNPGGAPPTVKDKKGKSKSALKVKKEGLRVKIVPPEEIHRVLEVTIDTGVSKDKNQSQQDHQVMRQLLTQSNQSNIQQQQHPPLQAQSTQYHNQPQHTAVRKNVPSQHSALKEPPRNTEAKSLVPQLYTQQSQMAQTTSLSSGLSVMQQQPQLQHKKQPYPVALSMSSSNKTFWTLNTKNAHHHLYNSNQHHTSHNIQNHQQSHHYQQVLHSQQQQRHQSQTSKLDPPEATKQEISGGNRDTPSPEPWYSGMPQVHAPTTQELQQSSYSSGLKTSTQDITTIGPYFSPDIDYLNQLPSVASQHQQQTMPVAQQTSPGQIYTISVADKVTLIRQVAKVEGPVVELAQDKPVYFSG